MDNVFQYASQMAFRPCVLVGDFNCTTRQEHHPVLSSPFGFRSLAYEAPFDFTTYWSASRSAEVTNTAIDDILVSQPLSEFASPATVTWPRALGHAAVMTTLHIDAIKLEPFEVVLPVAQQTVYSVSWTLTGSCSDALWQQFCRHLDTSFNSKSRLRGTPPVFRKREHVAVRLQTQLSQAFAMQDYDAVGTLLDACRKADMASINGLTV